MASLGFSDAQSNFSQDYRTLCSQQDSFAQSNSLNTQVIRVADANLAQAFTECVSSQTFIAYLEPTDTKQFQIIASYKPTGEGNTDVVQSLRYNHAQVTCDNPPHEIGPQGTIINCSRNDEATAVQLALNTTQGSEGFRIPAYVPPPPPPPFQLPVGTIIAFGGTEAQAQAQTANGWWICDGRVVSDLGSPWNGQHTPQLSQGSFLRGAANAGGTGGAVSQQIPSQTISSRSNGFDQHDTFWGDPRTNVCGASGFCTGAAVTSQGTWNAATVPTLPPYYEVIYPIRVP